MTLYREEIFEHYKNPQNYGQIEGVPALAAANPLCGDSQNWYVKVTENTKSPVNIKAAAGRQKTPNHEDKIIEEIKFTGEGCAISTAAASLLSEELKGKPMSELVKIDENRMSDLLGTKVAPGRIKCLMLPLQALKKF